MAEKLIRDGLLTSARVGDVSEFAEVLFVRLILASCPLGRFTADPAKIRTLALPNRPRKRTSDIASALQELQRAGLIIRYTAPDGTALLSIPRLGQRYKFAVRSPWPPPPEVPDVPGQEVMILGDATAPPVIHKPADPPKQKKEEKRGEVKKPAERGPATLTHFSDFSMEAIQARWPGIDVEAEAKAALRKLRKQHGDDYQLDLKWFEQRWLPSAGPKFNGKVALREPDGWRAFINHEWPDSQYADGGNARPATWADLPGHVQKLIVNKMKGAA